MTTLIQIRRGNSGDRPTLSAGEFGLDLDTDELWIGTPTGNLKVYPPVPRGDPALFGTPVAGEFTYWHSATEVTGLPQVTWDSGNTRVALANTVGLQWTGRSILTAPDDGSLRLTNSAVNDAGSLIFGPSTIAFPRIKRDGVGLQARLASDTDWTTFAAGAFIGEEPYRLAEQVGVPGSIVGYGQLYCKASDSELYYMDSAGVEVQLGKLQGGGTAGQVAYWDGATSVAGDTGLLWDSATDVLQFGGTTNAFPGLARSGATSTLVARLADNSGNCPFQATSLFAQSNGLIAWSSSSRLSAPSDGDLLLTDNAGTSSGLLMFGGTTVNEPALRANGANLEARKADNSASTTLLAAGLQVSGNVIAGAGQQFVFETRSRMSSPSDGIVLLTDNAGSDFSRLCLGGTTTSYPALRRSAQRIDCVLADLGDFAELLAKRFVVSDSATSYFGFTNKSRVYSSADGYIELYNQSQTGFTGLRFGGVSASEPMLMVSGSALQARFADNSNFCNFFAAQLSASASVQAGSAANVQWATRSRMSSTADGSVLLTDAAGTDFDMLCFGGYGSASYPALQRSGTTIIARTSDGVGYAGFQANSLSAVGNIIAGGLVRAGSASRFEWLSRSQMQSPADGAIELAASGGSGTACYVELNEFASGSDPAAPGANKARWFVRDNGSGKGELCVRFPSGAVQVIASEP